MKALVKTMDAGSRINPTTGEPINPFRPSVVTITDFITTLVMGRKLKPMGGELPDSATDADFEKYWKDSDKNEDLAVSSFMSKVYDDVSEEEEASLRQEHEGAGKALSDAVDHADTIPAPKPAEVAPVGTNPGQINPKNGAEVNGTNQATSAPAAKEQK